MTNKKDVLRGDPLIYLKRTAYREDVKEAKPISHRDRLAKMLSKDKAEGS